jgi:hypothetical protein
VQRPGVLPEPVYVSIFGEFVLHGADSRAAPRVVRREGSADHRQQQGGVNTRVCG